MFRINKNTKVYIDPLLDSVPDINVEAWRKQIKEMADAVGEEIEKLNWELNPPKYSIGIDLSSHTTIL